MAPALTVRGTPIGYEAVYLAILASMGGFLFGYDTGMISGIVTMDDFKRRFVGNDLCRADPSSPDCAFGVYQEGTIVALLSVGTLVGALIGAPLADYFGRRLAMTIECGIFTIGIIIQLASFTVWQQIAVGRLISGFGVGALSIAVPVYQSETVPRQLRGALVATYQLFITAGILVAAIFNLGTEHLQSAASWRITVGLSLVFCWVLGLGILFVPESPRWLAVRHRDDEAIRSIARVRGVAKESEYHTNEYVAHDFQEIAEGVRHLESLPKASWLSVFEVREKTLYRTLMGVMLQAGQQLTGANYFFYYGTSIFTYSGSGLNPYGSQCVLNAVNVGSTFVGLYVMQKYGRRWPLIIGGIGNAIWLIAFGAVGVTHDPANSQGSAKFLIVAACFFIFSYATTWAPAVWILMGESFSARTRAKQSSLSTASNWLWNFMIAFFTQPIVSAIGFNYGFVFAGCNLFFAAFVFFILYESSGLSLEQVDAMYNDPNCKPWTSNNWSPAGYSSRYAAAATTDKVGGDNATLVERVSQEGNSSPKNEEKKINATV